MQATHSPPNPSQPPAPAAVVTTLTIWFQIERAIAVLAFSFIGALVFADVALREFFGPVGVWLGFDTGAAGVYGAGKISLYLLVLGVFSGLGLSAATGTQIVPRVAFGWVPGSWVPAVERLSYLFSGVFLFAVAYYGVVFVLASRDIGTVTPGLEWPAWIIQSAIPLGFASTACRYFAFSIWPGAAPALEEFQE